MTTAATKFDYQAYRAKIQAELRRLFVGGLGRQIERDAKALATTPDDAKLRRRYEAKEAMRVKFAKGEFPLEPDMKGFFSRDADGHSGAILSLLYFGTDRFVRQHPASTALTGDEREDKELRDLIVKDLNAIVAVHSEDLLGLVRHLEAGCSECVWASDIVAKYEDRRKAKKELKAALVKQEEQASAIRESRRTIDNQRQEIQRAHDTIGRVHQDVVAKDARIAELVSNLDKVSLERDGYRDEVDRLRRELDANPAQKTLVEIAQLVYTEKGFEKWTKERRNDRLLKSIGFLLRFFQKEKGAINLREKAQVQLDAERRRLVEDDRVQLRDRGHPKFANRLDLVKAIQPFKSGLLEHLLRYRRDWDKELAGRTVNQRTFEKLYEGLERWRANSTIRSLWELSRISGIDRKTLKKYHQLGIADLSRWIPEAAA